MLARVRPVASAKSCAVAGQIDPATISSSNRNGELIARHWTLPQTGVMLEDSVLMSFLAITRNETLPKAQIENGENDEVVYFASWTSFRAIEFRASKIPRRPISPDEHRCVKCCALKRDACCAKMRVIADETRNAAWRMKRDCGTSARSNASLIISMI